jgi:hypothetical protein
MEFQPNFVRTSAVIRDCQGKRGNSVRRSMPKSYGQRFAVSSHPAARAGCGGTAFTAAG